MGLTWSNQQSNSQDLTFKLVTGVPGSFFYHFRGPSYVVYNPNPTNTFNQPYTYRYQLLFDASSEGLASIGNATGTIGLAYSTNGTTWTLYQTIPVMIPAGPSTWYWDATHMFRACLVTKGFSGLMELFYSGSNLNIGNGINDLSYAHGTGHAISNNGIQWRFDPYNPQIYFEDARIQTTGRSYTPFVLYGTFGGPVNQYRYWFVGGVGNTTGQSQTMWFATYTPYQVSSYEL